jgi:hypothetical protein
MSQGCPSGLARASPKLQHLSASLVAVIFDAPGKIDRRVGEATSLPWGISVPHILHSFAAPSGSAPRPAMRQCKFKYARKLHFNPGQPSQA